jgi:hypothetical protein
MEHKQHAGNCRWATPTLYTPAPYWLAAEDFAWSCVRDTTPRLIATTEACETCPRWEERERVRPRREDVNVT